MFCIQAFGQNSFVHQPITIANFENLIHTH